MIHFHRFGTGEVPVLALHGWAGTGAIYGQLAERLENRATVWAPDLPGYGASTEPKTWDLQAIADSVVDHWLAVAETDRPPVVVGTCSGAIVALYVARALSRRTSQTPRPSG